MGISRRTPSRQLATRVRPGTAARLLLASLGASASWMAMPLSAEPIPAPDERPGNYRADKIGTDREGSHPDGAGYERGSRRRRESVGAPIRANIPPSTEKAAPAAVTDETAGATVVKTDLAKAEASDEEAEINVRNAELAALIRIFSKRTKRNYLLDDRIKGKVTMYLPGKLSSDQSVQILDSILALKGFTTVPIGDNLWKILPSKEARQSTIPTRDETILGDDSGHLSSGALNEGAPQGASVVTKLLPLKYASADEVQPLLAQLVTPDGFVSSVGATNSLILIDYEDNVARVKRILDTLDVPFANRDMTIIPIRNAEATDIAEKLKDLLGLSGDSRPGGQPGGSTPPGLAPGQIIPPPINPPGQPPGGLSGRPTAAGMRTNQRSNTPKIIADDRTNSLIVVADDDMTARIKALVFELDSKVDLSGRRFYVYRCQHAKAEDLAQVLSGLAGGGQGGSAGAGGAVGRSPNSQGNSDDGTGSGSSLLSRRGRSGSSSGSSGFGGGAGGGGLGAGAGGGAGGRGGSGGQARSVVSVQFGQDASITADPATNSLIILTDKSQYEKIKNLIDKLDIKRRQVLVEAMLLEVSIDNNQTLGFDFLTSTGGADGGVLAQSSLGGQQGLQGLLSDPRAISGFSIAAASRGSLHLPGGITIPSQAVMLSALQTNQNVNVLSAPTLLATDNEAAEIVVGQNVPFLASTSTNQANLNNTFNQINRQDVGITLRLTPQISSEDFVKLSIFTNVSDIVPTAATNLGPTTTVRSSETTVITKDSQMIAIGGLMADQNNESDNGVPFLKDIPILGQAFQRSTARRLRTNLLTFITPHIVKDQFDNRDMTISQRDRIQTAVQESKTGPDRHELLQNPAIDDVADIDKSEVQAPGTVRPQSNDGLAQSDGSAGSVRSFSSQPQSDVQRRSLRAPSSSPNTAGPLALKVAPPLPPGTLSAQSAPDGAHRSNAIAPATSRPEYFVLRVLQSPAHVTDLPISPDGMVGIIIPEGTGPEYREFFRLGRKVSFGTPTGIVALQVAEKHLTPEIPQQTHQIVAESWHSLSPHELLSLGSGPWVAEGRTPKQ